MVRFRRRFWDTSSTITDWAYVGPDRTEDEDEDEDEEGFGTSSAVARLLFSTTPLLASSIVDEDKYGDFLGLGRGEMGEKIYGINCK